MKIVYIAHAISSDVPKNLRRIREILRMILVSGQDHYCPIAPYLPLFDVLDNSNPEHYKLGLNANKHYFERRFVDELWVFGEDISRGVRQEAAWAYEFGIPVIKATILKNGQTMMQSLSQKEWAFLFAETDGPPLGIFHEACRSTLNPMPPFLAISTQE